MTKFARWIVIEGLDGAGKTSGIATIQAVFKKLDLPFLIFREPGGTTLGEEIRQLFKSQIMMTPFTEVLLMYAARLELLHKEIFPALDKGISVILDRHELSSFAYQSGGRGVDIKKIRQLSQICMPARKPDLTLYLKVDPKLGLQRVSHRGELDAIEAQGIDVFQRMAEVYAQEIKSYPDLIVIDANQPFEAVQAKLYQVVENDLQEALHAGD